MRRRRARRRFVLEGVCFASQPIESSALLTRVQAAGQSSGTASRPAIEVSGRPRRTRTMTSGKLSRLVSYMRARDFFIRAAISRRGCIPAPRETSAIRNLAFYSPLPCSILVPSAAAHESRLKQQRRAVSINFKPCPGCGSDSSRYAALPSSSQALQAALAAGTSSTRGHKRHNSRTAVDCSGL